MDKVQHHITEMYHYLVNSNEALNHDWRCCEFNPTVKFGWLESLDTLEKTLWAISKESDTLCYRGEKIYPDDSTIHVKTFMDIMNIYSPTQKSYAIKAIRFEYKWMSSKVAEALVENYLNFIRNLQDIQKEQTDTEVLNRIAED